MGEDNNRRIAGGGMSSVVGAFCGITVPVQHATSSRKPGQSVGIGVARVEVQRGPSIAIVIRHRDGTTLAATLDSHQFNQFVDIVSRHVQSHNEDVRASEFGELG